MTFDSVAGSPTPAMSQPGIDLWWLPLGAGGRFVRTNGRIYERIKALSEQRKAFDLYHTAIETWVPEGRFVIENAWPIPNADGPSRGVVIEGPVFHRRIARLRALRYEIRRWRNGVILDAGWAVGSPQRISNDIDRARRLLELVPSVPPFTWGRDEARTGEMWNSNSVVSWLLVSCGLPVADIHPPMGGRAPGWGAGVLVAQRPTARWKQGSANPSKQLTLPEPYGESVGKLGR
jgi:hypothetical protein